MADSTIIEIVEQFKSRDIARRMAAVSRAAEAGTPEAVALLVKALQDPSWSLREHAVASAAAAGEPAKPSLVRLLGSGVWFARASAARVLEVTGDERALVPLALQTGDANASVSQAAGKSLSAVIDRIGPVRSLDALAACPAAERARCSDALRKVRPALAERWEAEGGAAVSEDVAAYDPGKDGTAGHLQNLRKAVRAALKQDTKDDDEEP